MENKSELSFEGKLSVEGFVFDGPKRFRSIFPGSVYDNLHHLLEGTDPQTGKKVDVEREIIDGELLLYERLCGKNLRDGALLKHNFMVIADIVAGNPDGSGEAVFARYATSALVRELVLSLSPLSVLVGGSLDISQDQYQAIRSGEGVVIFSRGQAASLRNNIYDNPNKKRDEFWDVFSGGNPYLVRGNAELVRCESGRTYEKNAMGVYISKDKGLRPLWVGSIENYSASADDNEYLINMYVRLVGVVSKTQSGSLFQEIKSLYKFS